MGLLSYLLITKEEFFWQITLIILNWLTPRKLLVFPLFEDVVLNSFLDNSTNLSQKFYSDRTRFRGPPFNKELTYAP